jgi:hypothetical protein
LWRGSTVSRQRRRRDGRTRTRSAAADDRVLPITRAASVAIIPFLLLAVAVLHF